VRWLATAFAPVALTASLIFGRLFIYNSAMAFDAKVAEARLALDLIETTEMPKLAWDALEAGLDGPAIRRLAALEFPTFFETRDLLPRVMEEMHLMKLGAGEAAPRLAKMRAQEVLRSNADVLQHVGDFQYFWVQADYCYELRAYGSLGEEAYVARYMGQTEMEIRTWVLDKFKRLPSA
jgi:hypothetical protein